MPSALETLVKILKLEQETGYKNTAVIGGLSPFAANWERDAHQQAKRPEHHQLIDELVDQMRRYETLEEPEQRHEAAKYMLGRIMGRIPAPPDLPPSSYAAPDREDEAPPDEPAPEDEAVLDEEREEVEAAEIEDSADVEFVEAIEEKPAPPPKPRRVEAPPAARPTFNPPRRRRRETLSPEVLEKRWGELQAPVTTLPKIGVKMGEKLDKLGIRTVEDMLFAFPRRYDDYTRLRTINHLNPGETVTVAAAVRSVVRRQGKRGQPYLLVTFDDETDCLQVAFFGQPWLQRQFKRDLQVVLSGTVELFRGEPMMTNPEWEPLEPDSLHTNRIVPVYALTKGLAARTMRRLMHQVVENYASRFPDPMPESILARTDLPDIGWALNQVHFPDSFEALELARRRLSFDELFLFQTAMLAHRRDWQSVPGQPFGVDDGWLMQYIDALPYTLTHAQRRALDEIRADLARDVPMNRLLQGDVGSGKTVVAAVALAIAAQSGKQAALMAPTSILAEQHFRSVGELLRRAPNGEHIHVRLLTGNTAEYEREEIYRGLAEGWIHVVIGTHALIQEGVNFQNLALAIIDEQHRFGVQQRGILRGKGFNPHILIMTATPIPRTLALTLYADLDLSLIDEMPPGRAPVETRVLRRVERERAYSFIRSQLDKGRQAFIIYPLVESSEKMDDVGAAADEYERLKTEEFPKHRVGLLHGRMKPAEKDEIMQAFAAGQLDVLVATSVVEVGIDVPNASVILIEDANRFGLAQLHQFRGRVGRGEHPSFCLLIAASLSEEADQRLTAMEETTDGFKLAEVDWAMRGPGDLIGVRQSGIGQFRLAEIMNPRLVELAQREARTLFAEDPRLEQPDHTLLAERVRQLVDRRADIS
jgi:ATP-dependent DNA helicase RecG